MAMIWEIKIRVKQDCPTCIFKKECYAKYKEPDCPHYFKEKSFTT